LPLSPSAQAVKNILLSLLNKPLTEERELMLVG
jgi:LysR family nitrogen assimilation transcriptional regulator